MKKFLIQITGVVQGVGFRPFIAVTASRMNLSGTVCNKGSFVEIYIRSEEEDADIFINGIKKNPPSRAIIFEIRKTKLSSESFIPEEAVNAFSENQFKIIQSEKEDGNIFVSPDIAICSKCSAELMDKNDRRYLHPFINCTDCGPRLTILDSMPYDRKSTSMGKFKMCAPCNAEYTDQTCRRFHAQPVCCKECGPEIFLLDKSNGFRKEKNLDAISTARKKILEGRIIAVKGIGGFHLCCDATNTDAVTLLRSLKKRKTKPFAIMARNMEAAEKIAVITEEQKKILDGFQKPILLLDKNSSTEKTISNSVAPGQNKTGIMLPYTPLHILLYSLPDENKNFPDYLVMTSGNKSSMPICCNDEEALEMLSDITDIILTNNREIKIRADDSVCNWFNGTPYMIRRSRGYAPLPVMMEKENTGILAIGGELKNSFCISKGKLNYISPYIGDLTSEKALDVLEDEIKKMTALLQVEIKKVICDLHPKYNSTIVAKKIAENLGCPLVQIQHHYAHVASCLAENNYKEKVIGISFDGTGYGTDGTIWGGEFFIADFKNYKRIGSIKPFIHAGGDSASKAGWKIAANIISDIYGDDGEKIIAALNLCTQEEFRIQKIMAEKKINAIKSTSAGRIFDAVAAILGIKKESDYEGEAASLLQAAAEKFISRNSENETLNTSTAHDAPEIKELTHTTDYEKTNLCINIEENESFFTLPEDEIIKLIIQFIMKNGAKENAEKAAYIFHDLFSSAIAEACVFSRTHYGINTVALTGGVMQNTLFLKLIKEKLEARNFGILLHKLVPPNDGGLALGQAVAGACSQIPCEE